MLCDRGVVSLFVLFGKHDSHCLHELDFGSQRMNFLFFFLSYTGIFLNIFSRHDHYGVFFSHKKIPTLTVVGREFELHGIAIHSSLLTFVLEDDGIRSIVIAVSSLQIIMLLLIKQ